MAQCPPLRTLVLRDTALHTHYIELYIVLRGTALRALG